MKKKIVHIAQSAGGGVTEYLYMFLKNFNNKEYDNFMIVSEDYEEQKERFKPYIKEIYTVPMERKISVKPDLKAIIEIRKKLKIIKPDIVYLHSSKAGALGRIALLFNFKIKILYNAHGWYFNAQISKKKKKIYALIEKILAFKTNKIINISKNEYESALKYKIAPTKKMCVIENGIDFKKFEDCNNWRDKTRRKNNIKEEEIVIGVVGRISEQKDPMTTIKSFNILKKSYKGNLKLMLIGSGNLEQEVLYYAKQNNIENDVIITGWTENVEKYIPALDIAILPSKWEGFGLVLLEYMACDKPIVASNIGGIPNIIKDGINGYLIECGDCTELSNKIKILIENKSISQKFIEENREYRKKYDIKNVIKKHIDIFNQI